jgi:hypothetical protein
MTGGTKKVFRQQIYFGSMAGIYYYITTQLYNNILIGNNHFVWITRCGIPYPRFFNDIRAVRLRLCSYSQGGELVS